MTPPRYLPEPYRLRKIRFGWDRHDIGPIPIGDLVFHPNAMSGAGWIGSVANISDPQMSGVAPIDDTPATYDGIYAQNGTQTNLVLDWPSHISTSERMFFALAMSSCQNGVIAPHQFTTLIRITIRSPQTSAIWTRDVEVPRSGSLQSFEWDFDGSQFNLTGLDLDLVQVTIQPMNLGGAVPSGVYISYCHFRFSPR